MKKKLIIFSIIFIFIFLLGLTLGSIIDFFRVEGINASLSFVGLLPHLFSKIALLVGLFLFCVIGGYVSYLLIRYNLLNSSKMLNKIERADSNEYGSAEFMTDKEMKGFYGNKDKQVKNHKGEIINGEDYTFNNLAETDFEGYVVKSYKNRKNQVLLEGIDHEHCLVIGTNGSGKSTKFLIPTILCNANSKNKPSMLLNDLKGELFETTSKFLKDKGYNVVCINLRTPRNSTRFNPLEMIFNLYQDYLKTGNGDIADKVSQYIIEIANTIVDEGHGANKEFNDGARGILIGILYGLLEDSAIPEYKFTKDMFTFQQVSNVLNKQTEEKFMEFLTNRDPNSKVWDYASMIIGNQSPKTISSYLSTLKTGLQNGFLESGITYLTSACDFDIDKIVKEPTAIFMIIPDESAGRYKVAISMIVQIYNYLTYKSTLNANLKLERTFYFLLDEFGNMPKMTNFAKYISTSRGRNIFFCPIVQATSQFTTMFSEAEAKTIQDQCHLKVLIGSNEYATLEYFQKELGTFTINTRSVNMNTQTLQNFEYSGTTSHGKKNLVEIEDLRYKNQLNANIIYFTNYGKKPCKSEILPSFDKDTFAKLLGSIKNQIQEKKIDYPFYNLETRTKIYHNLSAGGSDKKESEEFYDEKEEDLEEIDLSSDESEDDGFVDLTDDYAGINKEDGLIDIEDEVEEEETYQDVATLDVMSDV